MTKEEILKQKYSAKVQNWEKAFHQNPSLIEAAYEAMTEIRRQTIQECKEELLKYSKLTVDENRFPFPSKIIPVEAILELDKLVK